MYKSVTGQVLDPKGRLKVKLTVTTKMLRRPHGTLEKVAAPCGDLQVHTWFVCSRCRPSRRLSLLPFVAFCTEARPTLSGTSAGSVFHRWLTWIFQGTSCFYLPCWVEPAGIGVVGKIFHPTEDMPEASPSLWIREAFLFIPELVAALSLAKEVVSAIVLVAAQCCGVALRWARGDRRLPCHLREVGCTPQQGFPLGHTCPVHINYARELTLWLFKSQIFTNRR